MSFSPLRALATLAVAASLVVGGLAAASDSDGSEDATYGPGGPACCAG